MGPLAVEQWGRRLLYIELFVVLIVISGQWHRLGTYLFLVSAFCFILPYLFFMKDKKRPDET